MKHHNNPVLSNIAHLAQTFLDEIERVNWKHRKPPIMAYGITVS